MFSINITRNECSKIDFQKRCDKKNLNFVNFKKQIISKKIKNILLRFKHEIKNFLCIINFAY